MDAPLAKYSVFLSPSANDFRFCESRMGEYSRTFGIPPFEPHVTVYSGTFPDPEALKEAVSRAVAGMGLLRLRVRGAGCSEEYFKTLYIDFHEDQILQDIRRRIGEYLPVDSGYRLAPHLSLLYRDMPLSEKQALAQGMHFACDSMSFDRISIATPGNSTEGWRDTTRWNTVWRTVLEEGK